MSLRSESPPRHVLLTSARPEAFTRLTRSILGRLGYGIWTAQEYRALQERRPEGIGAPELLIMDEHKLDRVGELDPSESLPIILLAGRAGIQREDGRLIGAVRRPAGVHDLYRVLQRHYEERPRSTPRVDTELRATCRRRGQTWEAAVLSLSDNGCLLRSGESIPLGSVVSMSIELPGEPAVEVEAETAYQIVPDLGLVFSATPADVRKRIGDYVLDRLAAQA